MKIKCFFCRIETYRSFLLRPFYFDVVTSEDYFLCSQCRNRLMSSTANYVALMRDLKEFGLRRAFIKSYEEGRISHLEMDKIDNDSINIVSQKVLGISNPTAGVLINEIPIIVDNPTKRLAIAQYILDFSDIESYKVFDNMIEYNIDTPSSTQYELNTKNGLRRTIIGGMFAGSAGAVMGGLTSNQSVTINRGAATSYSTTEHNYTIIIKLKALKYGGTIQIAIGNNEPKMSTVVNIIESILHI